VAQHYPPLAIGHAFGVSQTFLLALWAGGGNVNPFLGLAHELLAEGHRVTALTTATIGERLTAAGIDVVGTASRYLASAEELLAAVDACSPDVLVVDYMLTGALTGAEVSGVPTAALVHTLYSALLRDGAPHPMGMAGPVEIVNDERAAYDLRPISGHGDLLANCDLVIVTAPRELDTDAAIPANLEYVGALYEGPGGHEGWTPPAGDGPLVVVTAGTAGDPELEIDLLDRVIAAIDGMDVRGFVTVADYIDRARLRQSAKVTVSDYVPHAAVLRHADLLVSHAGLGSINAALSYGVPMVCAPLDREQPENAAAVERLRAGEAVDRHASVDSFRRAIGRQLARTERVRLPANPSRAAALVAGLTGGVSSPAARA
jgi:UDP:flavonoid glycosyltransferase YjiC (YdhE family)